MRKRIVFALLVLLLANMACVAQYKAASFAADAPVTQTPTTFTEPVPAPTAWIVTVNTGETWNLRDDTGNVTGIAYGGDELRVTSITGDWYILASGKIHIGCCDER